MSELDLAAIRARAANLAEVRAVGPANFNGLAYGQLCGIAMAYHADVPALLDRIAELERQIEQMSVQFEDEDGETRYIMSAGTHEWHVQRAARASELERAHAAAMALVRAVADADVYSDSVGRMLVCDVDKLLGQARALLASETGATREGAAE